MPNETQNYLYILGDKLEVLRFQNIHTVDHQNGLFWDFVVSQKIISDTNRERYDKWGTTRAGLLTFIGHKILIETATTPCNSWLEYVIPKYPNLKFVMYFVDEFGEEFYGSVVGDKGEVIQSEYFDMINMTSDKRDEVYNNYVKTLLDTHELTR